MRERLRRAIRDIHDLAWSDAQLDQVINESIREYSLVSGSCIGSFSVISNGLGVVTVPNDFIKPVRFTGSDGFDRPFLSWKLLNKKYTDFRKEKSDYLQGVCFDFDGFGKIRLFPVLPDGTNAGTLYYQRLAVVNKLETSNIYAIEQYALYLVFLISQDNSAMIYYNNFFQSIKKENSLQRGISSRSNFRKGYFY